MNNLRYNNKTPSKYYYGATEVPSIYYGNTQVYSQAPSVPVLTRVGDGLGYGSLWIKVKGDYAYALGGAYSENNYVNTIKRYNLKTNTWENLSITLPARNYGVKPTLYTDGNFYVIGQWPSYNQIWKFNPDTPSISTIGTFNCATGDGIVYNGLIYRFGGFVKYNNVSNVYTYNPVTNTVQDTGMRISSAYQDASPVLVGNKAYVAVSKVLNIFNLDTNTREKTITFNASGHCFVTKHGNKLLFYSGNGSIFSFDIETETMTQQNETIPANAESVFTYKDTDYIYYKNAMYTYYYPIQQKPYTRIDYIDFTPTTYINTDVYPNKAIGSGITQVHLNFSLNSAGNQLLFTTQSAGHSNTYRAKIDDTVLRTVYGYNSSTATVGTLELNRTYTYDFIRDDWTRIESKLDGVSKVVERLECDGNSTPLILGQGNFRCYSCKITLNGELMRDYIPVIKNSDSKTYLLDTLHNKYYPIQGTLDPTTDSGGSGK